MWFALALSLALTLARVAAAAACGPVFQMVFLSDHVVNPSSGSLDSAFNGSQRINQAPISCPVHLIDSVFY
ncbi:hypothetical protein E1A91_A02G061400v1 [Gossypium mustelinum]|uniref:Uncharacterized protein n=3 Tax=Gossypium TaxID=3633 RepID=A0A5J5WL99_GOSBA|nr:hypothetical protein ES319_A02G057700v1 [Gossypium barbadense]TYI38937.1 hypothetical protein ES332_A02G064500v1 [Gossypium tomentosum]TYJ45506.1 hypothetical protein E1A91_A02G061400v1 [Gossypium mustelinum]